jgi:MFS family permease
MGLQSVLFAWLIAVYLGESGSRLGFAQMAMQLPALLLLLFGGLLADRIDKKKILIVFHCLAAFPVFILAYVSHAGLLSYEALLLFALAAGTFNAFIQPARDSLLNQVSGPNLQRAVTLTMGLTFFAQIIGFALASQADNAGPEILLFVQGSLLLAGAIFALKLPSFTPVRASLDAARTSAARTAYADIAEGLQIIFRSPSMFPVVVLMFAVGIFYMGSFTVLNPLVVRDVYGGAAADISLSFICFMIGQIFTTVILVSVGGVRHQGIGLLIALIVGGVFLSVTSLGLPFYGYLACIGLWGMCGGVAMSQGRSIIQENAPEEVRARALSVFSLSMMGGAPIGAVLMGFLSVSIGPLASYLVATIGVAVITVFVWSTTEISSVKRLSH